MKLSGLTIVGVDTESIRAMLDHSISTPELQNWINDRIGARDNPYLEFEDVNALLDFIAENLTEEQDL